jgi:hypothetical protein
LTLASPPVPCRLLLAGMSGAVSSLRACGRDQENRLPLHERTKLLKAYVGTVVPGFLQTPGYATALLSAIRDFH